MTAVTLRLDAYARDAKQVVASAQALADERRHAEVEPIHLLYRLIEREAVVGDAVRRAGIEPADVAYECEAAIRKLTRAPSGPSYFSPRTLDLLGRAEGEAARRGGVPVGVPQLFVACAQDTSAPVCDVLRATGLSAPVLRSTMEAATSADGVRRDASVSGTTAGDPFERFGRDLTRLASQGKFDPTVGRDAELRRVIQVLARQRENNPLLVGEPGIGKATIVRGLAARIAKNDVPRLLSGKRIVAIEPGALVAGAKLRGELEERVRSLVDAVRDSAGEVILFLQGLGAFANERSGAAAGDLIAAALARGEVRAIAVATPDEVRKAADADAALLRRFVPIAVDPPTVDDAVAVLRGITPRFEMEHGVRIADPALVAAVRLARRYVPSIELPKSAIDLVDEAAARVRIAMESVPPELDALERRLERIELERRSLDDDQDVDSVRTREALAVAAATLTPQITERRRTWEAHLARTTELRRVREELSAAQREVEQARAANDAVRAGQLRYGTIPLLEKRLSELAGPEDADAPVPSIVTAEDVADVVSAWTGVPVSKMLEGEAERLLRMEEKLGERIVGQDVAVRAVSKAVRRGRVGLRDPQRPIGSFLFLGPTGVGKTELAKALAVFLFDDEAALTRLDMSEFMEKHMVARLLGAPPGYVDSDEGGFLTEAVRKKPYSVVLFDEVEKAHADVFNILLQVLDDGRLTDSRGRIAHFHDTVVIMTSNVGSHLILDHAGDHMSLRERIEGELHKHFRPEFLNRIDDVVVFDPLEKRDLRGIVDIQLARLASLLAPRRITLAVTDAAKDRLVELGYDPRFGARPLRRAILKELQDPLAEELLRGGYKEGDAVEVDATADGFRFTRTSSATDARDGAA